MSQLNTPTQAAQPLHLGNAHCVAAELELVGGHGLGQDVGDHGVGGDVEEVDFSTGDSLAGKVVHDVDVLGAEGDDGVLEHVDGRLAVGLDVDACDVEVRVGEELAEPQGFLNGGGGSHVLSFGGGCSDSGLQAGAPGDGAVVEGEHVAGG